ncbi:hypothetical protein BK120_33695 [Paenibacillus sp. FSL A5-0031]|uniref:metal-dependent hydrolase n=1 Tax=Paenibacillus sp. FSL A5-0031 TaxID=1920420 RepID=UPI00096E6A9E|nr:metal-dependent hydrolase [Paenibacillus sp. FSL A5-0031]OME70111.1 hypothetical protein BK120_33695 [Paenibacillus sp. FSL A5-0031]
MMGKSHIIISTGITLSILGMADYKITIPVIAVTTISALLPDIDEPNSLLVSRAIPKKFIHFFQFTLVALAAAFCFLGQAFAPWNILLAVLVSLVSFMPTRSLRNVIMILIGTALIALGHDFIPWSFLIGCLLIVCALLPHRGLTHTLYGLTIWILILYFSTNQYDSTIWISGGLSYLLHLLADSVTNRGIRPLPPFDWRLKLNLMSTGTWKGKIVENGFIGLTTLLVWFVFFRDFNF